MLERLAGIFTSCGAESISIIVNERMTDVCEFVAELTKRINVPVRVVAKSTPSSMHSFFELSRVMRCEGKFILTTVDTIFRASDFAGYVKAFEEQPSQVDAFMAVTGYVDDEKPLYVAASGESEMRVTAFKDSPDASTDYVSGGIYGLTHKAFEVLDKCMTTGVTRMRNFQRALLAEGLDVRAYLFDKIIDVDHAGDIEKAEAFVGGSVSEKLESCQK